MREEKLQRRLLSKLQRLVIINISLIVGLVLFQTVNGKYVGQLTLVWGWAIVLTVPLLVTAFIGTYTKSFKKNASDILRLSFYAAISYFTFLLVTLVIVIPIAWLNARIGYVTVFKNSFWLFIPFQLIIIYSIIHSYRVSLFKKISWKKKRQIVYDESTNLEEKSSISLLIKKKGKLKTTDTLAMIQKCRTYISENKVKEAVQLLKIFFGENNIEEPIDLSLINGEWNKIESDEKLGLIDFKDANLRLNNLRKVLLIILQEINKDVD